MPDKPEKRDELVDAVDLAEKIRRGVDELEAAINKLPTKADWAQAMFSALLASVAVAAVVALLLAYIGSPQ